MSFESVRRRCVVASADDVVSLDSRRCLRYPLLTISPAYSVVGILASSLARQPWNVDEFAVLQAVSLSTRDRLLKNWNETQLHHTQQKVKRAYYLSFEFLVGRQLDNALLNLDVKKPYEDASHKLGFPLEDLIDSERDMGLGNGGLGRLVSPTPSSGEQD